VTTFPKNDDEFHEARFAWERQYEKGYFLDQSIQHEMPAIAKRFKAHSVNSVLDHGCGSGRHVLYLARQGFEVVGLDIAPTGLSALFQKLVAEEYVSHTTLGDILQLPFADESFDGIISVRVIHHNRLALIQRTVDEMRRILKPQGLIWITVPVPKGHGAKDGKEIEPGTWVPAGGIEKGLPHHLFTEDELQKLFQHFTILELQKFSLSHFSVLVEKPPV
jgi:SAM-dependent methyltransferase